MTSRLSWRTLRMLLIFTVIIYGVVFIPVVRDYVRIGTSPVVIVVRRMYESVVDSVKVVFAIPTLVHENGALQAHVNELTALSTTNEELRHENDLLRKELNLTSPDNQKNLVAAQVISRASSVSQQAITVNKGTDDGFTKGMAVIAQGYLVGVVDDAQSHTSQITLLTSAQSLLPVVLQQSRSIALLKGGAGGLVADEIPRDVTIVPNEAVVTSNIGDVIKSGIPVGQVSIVSSGKSDVYQSARINSPIDLSRLEVVFGVR